jgi:ATP-dependent protease ClpP protease subunit
MKHSFRTVNGAKAKLIERISNLNPSLAAELRNISLPWYAIKNNSAVERADDGETTAEILIYDEIGGSMGVSAEQFATDMNEIEADKIDIRINSPGGSVFDAIAIYNSIVRHRAQVTTYVDGIAASAASIIAMAGDECVMMVGSQMMIHDALGPEMGNAKDHREIADFLDAQSDNLASIYKAKAGGTTEEWRNLMLAETWMFSDEAVNLKLADRVYVRPGAEGPDDEEIDSEETPEAPDLEAAMHKRHRLTNRGYKYTGREKAPNPVVRSRMTKHTPKSSREYDDMVAHYLANL